MTKPRWRKDVTPDGVVTHTDPSGRVMIEKHTHHYGPWLVKDLDLDERVAETEVSEAEAKRLAEDYLASPRPVPVAPGLAAPAPAPAVSVATPPMQPSTKPSAPPRGPRDASRPSSSTEESRRAAMAYAAAVHAHVVTLRGLADDVERLAVPDPTALERDPTPHATSVAAALPMSAAALSGPAIASLVALAAQADVTLDRVRRGSA